MSYGLLGNQVLPNDRLADSANNNCVVGLEVTLEDVMFASANGAAIGHGTIPVNDLHSYCVREGKPYQSVRDSKYHTCLQ